MSSTNKTQNLLLNYYLPSDKPQMADVNYDNNKIDEFSKTALLISNKATSDDAKAGTDDTKYMTPLKTIQAVDNPRIVPSAWTLLPAISADYTSNINYKKIGATVYFSGSIIAKKVLAAGTYLDVATLPEGFRPKYGNIALNTSPSGTNAVVIGMIVAPTGNLRILPMASVPINTGVYVGGSFLAEQ